MLHLHLLVSFKQLLKMLYKAILDTNIKVKYLPIMAKPISRYLDY